MNLFDRILSQQKGGFVKFTPLNRDQQNKKDINIQQEHKVIRYDFHPFDFLLFRKRR